MLANRRIGDLVAARADDDPWRHRVRQTKEAPELLELARTADPSGPVESLLLLVVRLARAGEGDRAADLGVDTAHIATALRLMVGGDERVTRFRDPAVSDDYDVQLRLVENDRNSPESISRLFVPSKKGGLVRLDNLVKITPAKTASSIDRLDRQRQEP